MKLSLAKVAEDVVVGQDPRDRALDPRGNSFGNVLTREQIEALPDDPDDMEAALKEMAGPGATIRVDGFRGGRLPPKSQIQSIRFRRDLFAAENHGGGLVFVDIATRPGGGPLRGSVDFTFRDEAMNARNAFAPRQAPEQQHNGTFTMSGTLKKDRTGFSFTSNGVNAYDSKTLNAAFPEQNIAGSVRRPGRPRELLGARRPCADQVAHASRELSAQRHQQPQPRRGRLRPPRPGLLSRHDGRCVSPVAVRPPRAELFQRDAVSGASPDERIFIVDRCANAAGSRRVHVGRGTDRRWAPRHRHRARERCRLRQGPALGSRGFRPRSGPLSQRRRPQYGRDVHVRQPRRLRGRTADDVHAAEREPAGRVLARAVWRIRAGRHARRAKPVDECRSSLRDPDPRRRLF